MPPPTPAPWGLGSLLRRRRRRPHEEQHGAQAQAQVRVRCWFCHGYSVLHEGAVSSPLPSPPSSPTGRNSPPTLPRSHGTSSSFSCAHCGSQNIAASGEPRGLASWHEGMAATGEVDAATATMYARSPRKRRLHDGAEADADAQAQGGDEHTPSVFCRRCIANQQIQLSLLAGEDYSDDDDGDGDDGDAAKDRHAARAARRADLDRRYPLVCAECWPRAEERIRTRDRDARREIWRGWMDARGAGVGEGVRIQGQRQREVEGETTTTSRVAQATRRAGRQVCEAAGAAAVILSHTVALWPLLREDELPRRGIYLLAGALLNMLLSDRARLLSRSPSGGNAYSDDDDDCDDDYETRSQCRLSARTRTLARCNAAAAFQCSAALLLAGDFGFGPLAGVLSTDSLAFLFTTLLALLCAGAALLQLSAIRGYVAATARGRGRAGRTPQSTHPDGSDSETVYDSLAASLSQAADAVLQGSASISVAGDAAPQTSDTHAHAPAPTQAQAHAQAHAPVFGQSIWKAAPASNHLGEELAPSSVSAATAVPTAMDWQPTTSAPALRPDWAGSGDTYAHADDAAHDTHGNVSFAPQRLFPPEQPTGLEDSFARGLSLSQQQRQQQQAGTAWPGRGTMENGDSAGTTATRARRALSANWGLCLAAGACWGLVLFGAASKGKGWPARWSWSGDAAVALATGEAGSVPPLEPRVEERSEFSPADGQGEEQARAYRAWERLAEGEEGEKQEEREREHLREQERDTPTRGGSEGKWQLEFLPG